MRDEAKDEKTGSESYMRVKEARDKLCETIEEIRERYLYAVDMEAYLSKAYETVIKYYNLFDKPKSFSDKV
ncbi:MAG: hypothetical protein ACPL07_02875 [Candidatus Bathyarchaeia archaeon]